MLSIWTSLTFCRAVKELTLFQKTALFLPVCSQGLLKKLGEKEKSLMMTNFSFTHSVSNPFGELYAIFI